MQYTSLVYNLLPNVFWSITPPLPGAGGAVGTRLPVGFPDEVIPDITFIVRAFTASEVVNTKERNHLNGYTADARRFHTMYGLSPIITINSFDDVLRHFQTVTTPIGRIRQVTHGSSGWLWLPVFTNGTWDLGIDTGWLQALNGGDETTFRYLFSDPHDSTTSPLTAGDVNALISGIRALNPTVTAPFGSGAPTGAVLRYFQILHDLYQVQKGTVVVMPTPPAVGNTAATSAQRSILSASLNRIESVVRSQATSATITDTELLALKTAVLNATPAQLGYLGPPVNLPATVLADVQAARAAVAGADPADAEAGLRDAFAGPTSDPVLNWDYLDGMVSALELLKPGVLRLGGTDFDAGSIRDDSDLQSFVLAAIDLHHLKNGDIAIDGTPITTPVPRADLRLGLLAISGLIRTRIRARPGNTISLTQLNTLRDAIENRPVLDSGLNGITTVPAKLLTELSAANTALSGGFRTRLDHFRSLMQPGDASKFDVRGCMVARTLPFLGVLRDFLGAAGTPIKKPVVSAPDWWQSFPSGGSFATKSNGFMAAAHNGLVANGVPEDTSDSAKWDNISGTDVNDSLDAWRLLIDFNPHFDFITALFASTASKLDFASLDWRAWQTTANPQGIPILRMEAVRMDDLTSLTLGDIVEQFRIIFEVPGAIALNPTARARLTKLQPHVAKFKTTSAALAAAAAPNPTELGQFLSTLSGLATSITGIQGFTVPNPAMTPPAAANLNDIQAFDGAIKTRLNAILDGELTAFFGAIQGSLGQPNPELRYFYNIGLPLLLQSSTTPTRYRLSALISVPPGTAIAPLTAAAFRSWMRIQWTGTDAQRTTMNAKIQSLAITNKAQQDNAAANSRLSFSDPVDIPTSLTGFSPMQTFHDHIFKNPP